MTPALITAITAITAGLGLAAVAGWLHSRRSGLLRETGQETSAAAGPDSGPDTSDLGLSNTGPTIVHFGAVWCGPCAGVRTVVERVCSDLEGLGEIAHVEIDMDANPVAARKLSVLSLPTTFIFDAGGRQRYRALGVPKAADLRSALRPLLV